MYWAKLIYYFKLLPEAFLIKILLASKHSSILSENLFQQNTTCFLGVAENIHSVPHEQSGKLSKRYNEPSINFGAYTNKTKK